jgi:hypothetical protein
MLSKNPSELSSASKGLFPWRTPYSGLGRLRSIAMAYWAQIAFAAVVGLVIRAIATAIYRLYFHPLARVPGPKLAAITWNYERYYDLYQYGQFWKKIGDLHVEYGMYPGVYAILMRDAN